ncbi:uncharacterized protein BJ171DRAFT_487505 [Polychytrium aggregatum]|uniref:uncharacterized protein n=1 Tax=Polychytrium aggregatum TaxID=110093 RepID=UPI0022FF0A61|nr:uncharacterized protein BJ171DRAFT_487505 [Polychytrium aggregatum]KAI9208856.1 hypothetical protein BJ171DRAFT_487505 [Polychytrium aggregatum]
MQPGRPLPNVAVISTTAPPSTMSYLPPRPPAPGYQAPFNPPPGANLDGQRRPGSINRPIAGPSAVALPGMPPIAAPIPPKPTEVGSQTAPNKSSSIGSSAPSGSSQGGGGVGYPEGYTPRARPPVPRVAVSATKKKTAKSESKYAISTSTPAAGTSASTADKKDDASGAPQPSTLVRAAGGEIWEDKSLLDWDDNDFRLFCGDLGNEVTDDLLSKAFMKYPSMVKVRVVRDKRTQKSRGYGFVSFKDPNDFVKALKEMNGKYIGNRPVKLRKSSWADRNVDIAALKKVHNGGVAKKATK